MHRKLKTLKDVDAMDLGMLGCEGEFYAYRLREEAKRWVKELENLKEGDRNMFVICEETTVKKPYERRILINFIKAFFNLEENLGLEGWGT